MTDQHFDVAVVGAGIVGLAHALIAARQGRRVVVIDRDAQANGASIRNFGFVTVTGQEAGEVWHRARRSRDIWAEIAGPAGIAVEQRGLALVARRPEARAVADAFLRTDMAGGCRWIDADMVRHDFVPHAVGIEGALVSDIDLRVESRTAIPALADWLAEAHGVTFLRETTVRAIDTGHLATTAGMIVADDIVLCTGDDLTGLFPAVYADAGVTRCKLQMLRLADPGYRLPAAVMSDLGMIRYLGYSALPEAAPLRARLEEEQPAHLAHGIHLIVTQSADGSLVVGDSHHYAPTPDPFSRDEVDALILDECRRVLGHTPPAVLERWTGTYASGPHQSLIARPLPGVTLVTVTSGTGASTAFGLAEEVLGEMPDIAAGELA